MCNWKKYFDQIICLHYLPMKERVSRIQNELIRVGIINSDIFKWDLSFDSPYYEILRKNMSFSNGCIYGTDKSRFGQFKCSYQHYEVIKRAFTQGLNRILILEDDIVFLNDEKLIEEILENIPNTDIVLLDKFTVYPQQYQRFISKEDNIINNHFRNFDYDMCFYSSGCYSLNRTAMEMIIKSQEFEFSPSDDIWNQKDEYIKMLTKSVANTNIAIQKNYVNHNDVNFDEKLAYRFVNLNINLYKNI